MKQAIKPEFFPANMPSIKKDEEAKKKGVTEEERHLYALSGTAGWRVLSKYAEDMLGDLDNINKIAMEQGMGFEEIGRNSVVVTQTKDIIRRLLNKVIDAVEACEKQDEKE
jgi:hypothetical protein